MLEIDWLNLPGSSVGMGGIIGSVVGRGFGFVLGLGLVTGRTGLFVTGVPSPSQFILNDPGCPLQIRRFN